MKHLVPMLDVSDSCEALNVIGIELLQLHGIVGIELVRRSIWGNWVHDCTDKWSSLLEPHRVGGCHVSMKNQLDCEPVQGIKPYRDTKSLVLFDPVGGFSPGCTLPVAVIVLSIVVPSHKLKPVLTNEDTLERSNRKYFMMRCTICSCQLLFNLYGRRGVSLSTGSASHISIISMEVRAVFSRSRKRMISSLNAIFGPALDVYPYECRFGCVVLLLIT
jgi:hypothetical protein